jgi:hypothetical protein
MKLRRWFFALFFAVALCALLIVGGCSAYVRLGTKVIGDFVSPDGVHDAVLIVRNGGAATGYSTGISLVPVRNPLARQLALIRGMNLFVVDDNDGAVRWGDRGQLDVKINWVSNTQLLVQYPAKARVFKQEASYQSTTVRYVPSP